MKRFALVALLAALIFGVVSSASATELKVKGNIDVYGMWSANLMDHQSDQADGDNYMTTQRMRTYFDFVASENLKAVLGLEIDNVWGEGTAADWGTDGKGNIEVKHAYLDFTFPDSAVNVKAGLQYVALPSVFGNPIFDDDAAALIVSAPITDMIGVAAGYSRGVDESTNVSGGVLDPGADKDDVDMAFIAVPVTLDGFAATPYFAYAWMGEGVDDVAASWAWDETIPGGGIDYTPASDGLLTDDAKVWAAGINAELTMFDPLTFAADLIYASMDAGDFETAGWYAALAGSYKFDFMTATLFGTYATGYDDDNDDQTIMPTLAEGWGISPYVGGVRAFSTTYDSFGTDAVGVGSAGTGLWTVGLVLADITFVENLSHSLTIAYGQGTSDKDTATLDNPLTGDPMVFTEEDSCWEVYLVNKYMIYENLAAINELGYFQAESDYLDDRDIDLDASYFATIGFQYKF